MTGPEHFLAAERLLGEASEVEGADSDVERYCLAAAQVHATLANAAATALAAEVCGDVAGVTYRAFDEWGAATATGGGNGNG